MSPCAGRVVRKGPIGCGVWVREESCVSRQAGRRKSEVRERERERGKRRREVRGVEGGKTERTVRAPSAAARSGGEDTTARAGGNTAAVPL